MVVLAVTAMVVMVVTKKMKTICKKEQLGDGSQLLLLEIVQRIPIFSINANS